MSARILIVEDNRDLLEDIRILLKEEGYYVYTAATGEEGIITAKKEIPDLVICDIMMSGLDGYTVLKELRKNGSTVSIPFIFLTAKADMENLRFGMQLGADDYIFKPFSADDLLKSIQTRIQKAEIIKKSLAGGNPPPVKKYSPEDKIFLLEKGQPHIIKIGEISFIEARNQYSSVHLVNGKACLVRRSISSWIDILEGKFFMRIHRSTIINLEQIEKMEKWSNSSLIVRLKNFDKRFIVSKKNSSRLRKNIFR